MLLSIVSFNGHNINDGTNYESFFSPETPVMPPVDTQFVQRSGAWPVYAGKLFPESTLTIGVKIIGTVHSQLETLNQWFSVEDETMHQLIVQDTADSNKQYYVNATCRQPGFLEGQNVYFLLVRANPVWTAVIETTDTWSVTASGDTDTITVLGNAEEYPIFEITPTAYPTGTWPYVQYVEFYQTENYGWTRGWLDITGGGFDTAALIASTDNKMTTDGHDIRVVLNGNFFTPYWIGGAGINTTDTKIFINIDFPGMQNDTLKTAIASTDTVTDIEINATLPYATGNFGRLLIDYGTTDAEEFTYTSISAYPPVVFHGVTRAVRGTVAANHSAGAGVKYIANDIQILYGNPSAPSTTSFINDAAKPVIDLTNSTNGSAVYTEFRGMTSYRSGSWIPTSPAANLRGGTYTGNSNGAETNPAECMGTSLLAYQSGGIWRGDTKDIYWQVMYPQGIDTITLTGQKYLNASTTTWPPMAALRSTSNGWDWTTLWNETAPGSYGSFIATTNTSATTSTTDTIGVRFEFNGSVNDGASAAAKMEIATATLNLINSPSVSRRAEAQIVQLDNVIIENTTTGDKMYINFPLQLNETLTIDTNPDAPKATYNGVDVSAAISFDTIRSKWMTLAALNSGVNVLSVTGNAIGAMTIKIRHSDRMLLW